MVEEERKRKVIETEFKTEEDKWNAATTINSSMYIKIENEETKTLKITDWSLDYVQKTFEGKPTERWELQALCVEEDGEKVDKYFNTSSKRLLAKLKPILKKYKDTDFVTLNITRVGEKFSTNYLVKEVKG